MLVQELCGSGPAEPLQPSGEPGLQIVSAAPGSGERPSFARHAALNIAIVGGTTFLGVFQKPAMAALSKC